jgi:hypothetical protein
MKFFLFRILPTMKAFIYLTIIVAVMLMLMGSTSGQYFGSYLGPNHFHRLGEPHWAENVAPGHVGHRPHPYGHIGRR